MTDLNELNQRTQKLIKDASFLHGQSDALSKEKTEVYSRVEAANKWLNKQPDYLKFLQHFQSIFHQKNIGTFNELLTFFVQDVLKKDRSIEMELYTYHNLPALRIESINDGCKENIYEGNGGSIANIVSTGLRLISLSRLSNRKFIILDEPDCWLEPRHVPLFAQIIGEISQKLKIQTIIISHHNWEYFKNYGRVISLTKDNTILKADVIHDVLPDEDDVNNDYIKTIHLRKFMSHYNTTYELHPYLTCIVGTNDIGKSVLSTAMKAVAYNDSSDSYIKHHEDSAAVQIDLSSNDTILWERFKATTQENPQKVKYTLISEDKKISEFNSNETPVFIQEKLNITMVEDIDIHIGNQKQPVFLLSPDVKPQEKAKILSLGKESIIIQKMMENLKNKTKKNKEIIKEGEIRYDKIEKQLAALSNIESMVSAIDELKTLHYILEKEAENLTKFQEEVNLLKHYKPIADIELVNDFFIETPVLYDNDEIIFHTEKLKKIIPIQNIELVDTTISIPTIFDNDELYTLKQALEKNKEISNLTIVENNIEIPNIYDLAELNLAYQKLKYYSKIAKIQSVKNDVSIPEFHDNSELIDLLTKYKTLQNTLESLEEKQDNLEKWKIHIANEINSFIESTDGLCPTCNQKINFSHLTGEHND